VSYLLQSTKAEPFGNAASFYMDCRVRSIVQYKRTLRSKIWIWVWFIMVDRNINSWTLLRRS